MMEINRGAINVLRYHYRSESTLFAQFPPHMKGRTMWRRTDQLLKHGYLVREGRDWGSGWLYQFWLTRKGYAAINKEPTP